MNCSTFPTLLIMFVISPTICLSLLVEAGCSAMWRVHEKERHPCVRPCVEGKPMTCHYHFKVELYYSMSKACYDCPSNLTHCYLEDCVHMDGYDKVLYTVNRQIPGPTIEVSALYTIFPTVNTCYTQSWQLSI